METRSRAASTESGVQQDDKRQRLSPPAIMTPETSRESLPPTMPPRAERSSQHERLLPHGPFRPPQLAGDLPRRDFLASDLSSRTSLLVHSRRAIFLAAIVTISCQITIPPNRTPARR